MVAKAVNNSTVSLCRLAISMSSFEYLKYKRFSHFVLKIIPLQYWVAVAMYTPLQILIQGLDEQLGLRKV